MTRSPFLIGAVAAAVTGAVSVGTFGATPTGTSSISSGSPASFAGRVQARPNIVLITTDDENADDLMAMPAVNRLLTRQGTTFSHYYTPFPLCGPSRASMLSGQYPHNTGVVTNDPGYADMDPGSTFAPALRASGYQTALVGKYVNGYGAVKPVSVPPGWSDWHGETAGGDYYQTRLFENGRGHLYSGPYQVDLVSRISADVIANHAPEAAPFFLWESYAAPHGGLPNEPDDPAIASPAVPSRFRNTFAGTSLPSEPGFNEADVSDKPAYVSRLHKLTPTMQSMMTEVYQQRLESLQAVDEAVQKTVDTLRQAHELSNTVIIFTTDNGWMMGQHRIHAGKTVPYDPASRLPLVIRGPGFPAGVRRSQLVANIDLAPTFLDVAHAGAHGQVMDGRSLLPAAASAANGTSRHLLFETGPPEGTTPRYDGVRTPDWLYIHYETGESEVYDMAKDPYQLHNEAGRPGYALRKAWLADMVGDLRNCAGTNCR